MADISYTKGSARRTSAPRGSNTSLQQELGIASGKISVNDTINGPINDRQSLSIVNGPINDRQSLSVVNKTIKGTINELPSMSIVSHKHVNKTGTVQRSSAQDNTVANVTYGSESFKFRNNTSIQDIHNLSHPLEDSCTVTSNDKNSNNLNVVEENRDFESETSESMNYDSEGPQFTEQNRPEVGIQSEFAKRDDGNKPGNRATRSDVFLKGAISEVDSIGFAGVDSEEIINNGCTPKNALVPGMDDNGLGVGYRSKSKVSISCIDFEGGTVKSQSDASKNNFRVKESIGSWRSQIS